MRCVCFRLGGEKGSVIGLGQLGRCCCGVYAGEWRNAVIQDADLIGRDSCDLVEMLAERGELIVLLEHLELCLEHVVQGVVDGLTGFETSQARDWTMD
jgi:hypothetical protein